MKPKNNFKAEIGKMFFFVAAVIILASMALAIPNSLNLQGKLTDTSGNLKTGTFNFTFRIYDNITNGTKLYETNITKTTDARGIYDIILQNINIPFDSQYYLAVKINNDSEMAPRVNLTSAPYSFVSNKSKALNTTEDVLINEKINLTATGNVQASGNLTLGEKITFAFGEIIDNIADGFIKLTGKVNVTGELHVIGTLNATGAVVVNNNLNITSAGNVNVGGTLTADTLKANTQVDIGGGFNAGGLTIENDGDIVTQGDVLFSGNVTIINVSHLSVNGSLIPALDSTFDVGNASRRWRNANFSGNLEVVGDITIDTSTLFVDSANNRVGIGIAGPNDALEIIGNVRISGSLNATSINVTDFIKINGNNVLTSATNSSLWNQTGNNIYQRLITGNVGIGTTSPSGTLEVSSEAEPSLVISPGTSTTANPQLYLKDTTASAGFNLTYVNADGDTYFNNKWDNDAADIFFRLKTDGTQINILTLKGTGNVGIGTTGPTKKLSVNGTIDAIVLDPSATPSPVINTTGNNLTVSSATGSVIIQLG